jgi:phosphopantothenoylcysteine decarboxylase
MANVLLGVTGSVAAIRTPMLYDALKRAGYRVTVVATQASLYFFDPVELDPSKAQRNPEIVALDEDEWPGHATGKRWQRDEPVLHIELRRWADLFLVAPLDANTLAKLASGLADNCMTCVWRAWDPRRPVVLAPAMNTLMWEHRLTVQHLTALAQSAGATAMPIAHAAADDAEAVVAWINQAKINMHVVSPQSKRLACGDIGVGAMAEVDEIVAAVKSLLPV